MTSIASPQGDLAAYVAMPTERRPWPGVVVIRDLSQMGQGLRNQETGSPARDVWRSRRTGFMNEQGCCMVAVVRGALARQRTGFLANSCPIVGSYGGKDRCCEEPGTTSHPRKMPAGGSSRSSTPAERRSRIGGASRRTRISAVRSRAHVTGSRAAGAVRSFWSPPLDDLARALTTDVAGLSSDEAIRRLALQGPNAIEPRSASRWRSSATDARSRFRPTTSSPATSSCSEQLEAPRAWDIHSIRRFKERDHSDR